MGVGVQRHFPAAFFPRERETVPTVQEAGWAPGSVWTVAENLAPTGIRSPDCPARSESLYRLRYPGPQVSLYLYIYNLLNNAVRISDYSGNDKTVSQ
jgi:hypothetical protein